MIGAVRSTGIYCKPSCPARRPKRENVEFFATGERAARRGLSAVPSLQARRGRPRPSSDRQSGCDHRTGGGAASVSPILPAPSAMLRIISSGCSAATSACRPLPMRVRFATAGREAALKSADRVTDAVYDAGYAAPSGFYSDAKERLGMTPSGMARRRPRRDDPMDARSIARSGAMLIAATGQRHLPPDLRRQRRIASQAFSTRQILLRTTARCANWSRVRLQR